MKQNPVIQWLPEPEEHDYPAAQSYLTLLYPESDATALANALKQAGMSSFKAKDIFRASGLALLDETNYHVNKDLSKIKNGDLISPLLLVRDNRTGKLLIADGYHRLCAVYSFEEDADIPCKII